MMKRNHTTSKKKKRFPEGTEEERIYSAIREGKEVNLCEALVVAHNLVSNATFRLRELSEGPEHNSIVSELERAMHFLIEVMSRTSDSKSINPRKPLLNG